MSDLSDLIDSLVEAGFSSASAKELAPKLGGIGNAVIENGVAKVIIGGDTYALLPVAPDGGIVANVAHRTGTLTTLLAASGASGEIGIPTDQEGLVVYGGAGGGAKFYRRLDTDYALGTASTAIGPGAATAAGAALSLALGPGASAVAKGEVSFGSAKVGVRTSRLTGYCATTNATATFIGPDGVGTFPLPSKLGLYHIRARFLVRENWTDNFAVFVRHAVVVVNEDTITATVLNLITPSSEPDFNSGLAGCVATIQAAGGPILAPRVTGLAGRNLNWSVFMDVCSMTEEVLL